jgi:hypothetical protein
VLACSAGQKAWPALSRLTSHCDCGILPPIHVQPVRPAADPSARSARRKPVHRVTDEPLAGKTYPSKE